MLSPSHAETFLREAEDLLADIEQVTLALRPGEPVGEPVHRLFRAFHTIKGSGAMFGFDAVAAFTHHVETTLDQVRAGALPLTARLRELILAARDHIAALLDPARAGDPATLAAAAPLIVQFQALATDSTCSSPGAGRPASAVAGPTQPEETPPTPSGASTLAHYHIRFRPSPGIMAAGTDPVLLLAELRALGPCTITADLAALPALDLLQPDLCYFRWDIALATDRGLNAIRDVFIFVEDGSEIGIELLPEAQAQGAAFSAPPAASLGQPVTPAPQTASSAVPSPIAKPAASATLRVSSERLDRLVTLVGELVMNQSRLARAALRHRDEELALPVEEFERLVNDLRDGVLGIRMMPIGTTFGRFNRLVHDLSAELGKEIDLLPEGADTEIDKSVLDQLGDPLVHLIRNSLDHGIESPDARERAGKPRRGIIRLTAAHTGSSVVITVQDDGRGLDPGAIRAKAVEKQLVAPDATLGETEIFNLIFLPGFSTAKQVTSISGRGVGMDVVKRQIDALRGSIHLASEPGVGTTTTLILPLTLAIIDGLLVEVAGERFILPMASVLETVEIAATDHQRHNARHALPLRGELVPYLRLRDTFAFGDDHGPALEKAVIVRHGRERIGLVVDRVLGNHQTVIQSLGRFYRDVEIASGATIMGDGRVALILDIAGLLRTGAPQSRAA